MPIKGHFIAKDDLGNFYDQTGIILPDEDVIRFDELKEKDFIWYMRIVRDCVI